jgi:hypothetical protein
MDADSSLVFAAGAYEVIKHSGVGDFYTLSPIYSVPQGGTVGFITGEGGSLPMTKPQVKKAGAVSATWEEKPWPVNPAK